LSLTGQTGDVIKWQYQVISDTPGPSWIDIGSSSTTTYTATNLSVATKYRVVVKSGQCASAYSSEETIDTETPPVSGTLTKSPNVANVCDGNDVSATLTPGSGGNLTDITEYRTKSGGSWGSWTAYTPGNAITTTGVTNVEIQTYREAEYCNDAAPNTVSWTIDPPTNAGAVTGGVPVCYGTNSTLLTLAGHSGTVQKWQYSTDNTNWTDIASHTQTTYTAVNLTQDTWYRAVVKSGDCLPANSGATEITVMSDFKISGFAKYENNPKTALDGLKITLKQGSTPVGSPVITGSTGYYEFSGLPNGTYDLTVESANSGGWLTWGGVNNTDYLLVSRHIAGTQYLPVNPPVVQITASVKLPHPAINNVDATAIRQAAKFPTTGFSYFDIPKWVFSGTTGATALTGITVSCSDVTRDIRGLCAGDVNGTYVPPSGYKTVPNQIHLVQKGTMPLNSEVTFPVSVTQSLELGAITLMLDYNPSALEITGIEMPVNGGIDPWFTVDEGVLLIGWWSLDPVKISRGDILMLVHARKVQDFSSSEQVYFALNQNPVSELADGRGEIISDVTLEIPSAGLKNSVAAAREEIVLTVYPNPATERLNVEYLLPEDAALSFELMDARGITFTLRSSESKMAGSGKESFNIDGLTPGVYMLKLKAGATVILRKVIVRP
jgi:hypothetical protein